MNDHMDKRPDDKRPNRNNPGNQGPNKNRQTILGIFDLSPDQFSLSEFCDRYDER